MPYYLSEVTAAKLARMKKKKLNYCYSDACPTPNRSFRKGQMVIMKYYPNTKYYHPECAVRKKISFEVQKR